MCQHCKKQKKYMNTLDFYIALFIHIVSFITAFGAVIAIDFTGLLWLLGWSKLKLAEVVRFAGITQRLIWLGWVGLVASGSVLIYHKGFIDNLTKIKLYFVVLVGLNGIFLHVIKKAMEKVPGEQLPARLKFKMALASMISQVGWWGALTIGFLHRQWRHDIPWPSSPWLAMFVITAFFAIFWLVGSILTAKKS